MMRDLSEIASILDETIGKSLEVSPRFKTLDDAASILDETIGKSFEIEQKQLAKAKNDRLLIRKAFTFDPMVPREIGEDSEIHNPYQLLPDGTFMPYSAQYWADQGKFDLSSAGIRYHSAARNPDGYRESEKMLTAMKSVIDDTVRKANFPIGTIHPYNGVDFKKEAPGKWVPVHEGKAADHPVEKDRQSKLDTATKELQARKEGKEVTSVEDKTKAANERLTRVTEKDKDLDARESDLVQREAHRKNQDLDVREAAINAKSEPAQSTDFVFKHNGQYVPERKKLHESILNNILDGVKSIPPPEGHKPMAVFTAGGPGSGKSSMVKAAHEKFGKEMAQIAADEVKKEIPEYSSELAKGNEDAAIVVHEESTDIAAEAIERCIESGKPFMLDSTFKNIPKFEKMIGRLKSKGYECHVLYAHCPADEAVRRSKERQKKTGRKVDEKVVVEGNHQAKSALYHLGGLVDSTSVFDTTARGAPPPALIFHHDASKKSAKDFDQVKNLVKGEKEKRLYDRFLDQIKVGKYEIEHDDDNSEIPFGDRLKYQDEPEEEKVTKSFPIGTIHEYQGIRYQKEAPGKWVPIHTGNAASHPVEQDLRSKSAAIEAELKARKSGKQVSPDTKRAQQTNEKHNAVKTRESDLSAKESEQAQRELDHRSRELDLKEGKVPGEAKAKGSKEAKAKSPKPKAEAKTKVEAKPKNVTPERTPEQAKAFETAKSRGYKVPPAWKSVWVNPDPDAALQVKGTDAKGRMQSIYSSKHHDAAAMKKFNRLKQFGAARKEFMPKIEADMGSSDEAKVLYLIDRTGFRIGSDTETGAKVKAYGASTLTSDHVKINGTKVTFEFVGKKGVAQSHTIDDAKIAAMVAGKKGRLFNTSDSKVRDYLKSVSKKDFKVKDFRTYVATSTALEASDRIPPPSTQAMTTKEKEHKIMEVSKIVAKKLGNTPKMARDSYIDPMVFDKWEVAA